jgi:membrane protease YdiL (CAAX protease family)
MSDVAIVLVILVPFRLLEFVNRQWLELFPWWSAWILQVLPLGFLLAFPFWLGRRRGVPFPRRSPNVLRIIQETAIAVPIVFVALLISALVVLGIGFDPDRPAPGFETQVTETTSLKTAVGLLIYAFTIGPVFEEVVFRGFLYNALRSWCPAFAAAGLQAGLFAFMHPFELAYSSLMILFGLGLALIYEWRKTLMAPILVHAGINLVAALATAGALIEGADDPVLGVAGSQTSQGCLVTTVVPNTPAERAGLSVGDVISTFDGQTVNSIEELRTMVRAKNIGDMVRLEIVRDGRRLGKDVILDRGKYD